MRMSSLKWPVKQILASLIKIFVHIYMGFPGVTSGKNPPANAADVRDTGLIPGLGRSPGEGHGNPLQYSCLENSHGQRSLVGYSP